MIFEVPHFPTKPHLVFDFLQLLMRGLGRTFVNSGQGLNRFAEAVAILNPQT
jgi:hypothetical protein